MGRTAPAVDRTWRSYLGVLCACAGAVVLLMVLFNLAIDPYGAVGGPRWPGINAEKPRLSAHLRLAKAAAVQRVQPEGVVLGTSRAEVGFNPAHPGWRAAPTYNLALAGTNIYEILRYFQHAHAVAGLEQAVLALDFFTFNAHWPIKPDFQEFYLAVDADGRPARTFALPHGVTAALSIDTLIDSIRTLRGQGEPHPVHRADGMIEGRPSFADVVVDEGQRTAFRGMERLFMTSVWFPMPARAFSLRDPDSGASTMEHFRRMLAIAHRNDIDLRLIITPAHARLWEALDAVGLWQEWENWKRALVRANEEVAGFAGRMPFPLWDFSGFDRFSKEKVPPPDDQETRMQWFWDTSHFRPELGDRILDRVLGHDDLRRRVTAGFGVRLTSANIEAHLDRVRAGLRGYRQVHTADVVEIREVAQESGALPD